MFKKLRERKENKKARAELQDVMLDNFAYCGDSEFPMFVITGTKYTNHRFFLPKNDEIFMLAFGKLKNKFYLTHALDDVKNKIRVYMAHFNISEKAYEYCVNMFINKTKVLQNTKENDQTL